MWRRKVELVSGEGVFTMELVELVPGIEAESIVSDVILAHAE